VAQASDTMIQEKHFQAGSLEDLVRDKYIVRGYGFILSHKSRLSLKQS
jgi:hypothetical protein